MTHHTPFVCQIKIYGILRATEDDVNFIVPCGIVVFYINETNNLLYQFDCLLIGRNLH